MKVTFLKAFNGDSIWISSDIDGKPVNILIDGGTSTTYSFKDKKDGKEKAGDLKLLIENIKAKNERLDLVVLTHIDDDHIDGFLKWFSRDKNAVAYIKELWFNSGRTIKKYLNNINIQEDNLKFNEVSTLTSVPQGVDFENLVKDQGVWKEEVIKFGDKFLWNDILFEILTPNSDNLKSLLERWDEKDTESTRDTSRKLNNKKSFNELLENDSFEEDVNAFNGSSITFILTYNNKKFLFLGDSHPSDVVSGLEKLGFNKNNKKLDVELVKLSHHGSQKNTSTELLDLIKTDKYVISTNGEKHGHPDKITIARILKSNPKAVICLNYPVLFKDILIEQDILDYPDASFNSVD